jgi:hypothetical protein
LGLVDFHADALEFLAQFARPFDGRFFVLPLRLELVALGLGVGDSRSMASCVTRRSSVSSSSGMLSFSVRSFAAASSMRSIALSGRKRSVM